MVKEQNGSSSFHPQPDQFIALMPIPKKQRRHGLRTVFQKTLTNSDVSNQQARLLMKRESFGCLGERNIPSKEHRPNVDVVMWDENEDGRRAWKFVYGTWSSNDSFVLKGGWRTFLDYKGLRAGDLITISMDDNQDLWIRHDRALVSAPS